MRSCMLISQRWPDDFAQRYSLKYDLYGQIRAITGKYEQISLNMGQNGILGQIRANKPNLFQIMT